MILCLMMIFWHGVVLLELLELKKKDSTWDQEWGPLGQATGTSSISQHAPHDGDENDKENDEGYKSCDDNDDGPLLNEDNDCVD